MASNFTPQDYELLSAYLDGELSTDERTAFERRLSSDVDLRRELDTLRGTVNLINTLPKLTAPRNFTLTPAMVRPARWLGFPTTTAFSAIASAAATLLILLGGFLLFQNTGSQAVPNNAFAPGPLPQVALKGTDVPPLDQQAGEALPEDATVMDAVPAPAVIVPTEPTDFDQEDDFSTGGEDTGSGGAAASGLATMPTEPPPVMPESAFNSQPLAESTQEIMMFAPEPSGTREPSATMPPPAAAAQDGITANQPTSPGETASDEAQGSAAEEMEAQRQATDALALTAPSATLTSVPLAAMTQVAVVPTAVAIPFPVPTPARVRLPNGIWDLLPFILIGVGLLLIVIALGTTVKRMRQR